MNQFDPPRAFSAYLKAIFPQKSLLRSIYRRPSFRKVILLLTAFLLTGKLANAASVSGPSIDATGSDEYGAYVEFYIPIKDQTGSHAGGNIQALTTGQLYYNNVLIAQYSAAHAGDWNNFQINVSIQSGYARAKGRTEDFTGMLGAGGSTTVEDGTSGEYTTLILRWYIGQDKLNTSLAFHTHAYATGYLITAAVSDDGGLKDQGGFDNYPSTSGVSFTIPDPVFDFSPSKNVGQMTVHYAYNAPNNVIGTSDYTVKHWIDNSTDVVTDNSNQNASGTLETSIADQTVAHTFHTTATGKGGYLTYQRNTTANVPAYVWPQSFTASYDNKDTITVQWQDNTSNLGTGFVDNDNFEVQRSTDPDFATNTVNVATYGYKSSQGQYTVSDNLSNLQGGTTVYYRIRRSKTGNDWNWQYAKTTSVTVNMNSTQKADTAVLNDSGDTPLATVTWEPFRGVWTNGTKFSLKKKNKTTGVGNSTIDLTEEEARSGKYVDENIVYCNEFSYSIVVTLGNSYPSPPEVPVPGSILAVSIGTIDGLTASKGYFPDRTELQWHSQGVFDNYIIKRKVYGSSDNFIQIANIAGSSTSDLQTDDSKGSPGVYYEYMVLGAVQCNNELKYSKDTLYAVGFRAPTGNIYGRITYENGQAVENASVRLQNTDNPQLGQSVYLNGNAQSYLKLDSLVTPFTDSAATIEAWIKPDDANPKNEVLFSRSSQYELGFDAGGNIYFTYNGQTVSGHYTNPNQSYVHVAGIHSNDSLKIMLNDSVIAGISAPFSASSIGNTSVYIGRNAGGNNYKGFIDEMSFWNVALPEDQIAKDYTRLLTGGEPGLAAYWRFDETISNEFYDISHTQEDYHRNDGVMDPRFVTRSNTIPTPDQLSLKAYTDSTGNYMISGIPYTSNGTTYTVVPLFGTHQFDPTSVNRLISASSSSFTVDFTDKSSFPVTGYVYYRDGTVPVDGVQFTIDGKYAQQSNGSLIQTDASGKFSIFVPVGTHEVKAVKANHVFVNDGRITDRHGLDLNYQSAVGPLILNDSTTIRFLGRVAGGAVQESYPLGHSLSTNNLGKELSITLNLTSGTKYELHSGTPDTTVIVDHLLPSNQTDSSKIHHTRVVYYPDKIVIYPDSLTGEFAADLIPETFVANNVNATGWGDLLEGKPVTLDFTNKFVLQNSVYNYQDSSETAPGQWSYQDYSDSVQYNDSYQFIKRVTPTVGILQLSNGGQPLSYFGDSTFKAQLLNGQQDMIPVIDQQKTGKAAYVFGYPVFTQGVTYHFLVKAYESYPFYESVQGNGIPVVAQQNNQDVVDEVPTQDGHVSFNNTIRDGATQADTLSLDSTGTGYYDFSAGDPAVIPPGTKDFSATVQFGQATNVSWSWLGDPKMQVFVMGAKQAGTDFVTAGPNKLLMVLRDPPGNRSYTFAESGSTVSNTSTYTGSLDQVGDETLVTDVGTDLITFTGIGVGTINTATATSGLELGVHHEEHYVGTDTKVTSTTLTTRFQTSDDPLYVGAPADLFVGYSTNVTYGQSQNLTIINTTDKQANDVVLADAGNGHLLIERDGISFGEKFGTLFAYPQQHIATVLIPNLIKIRNSILLPSSTSAAQAQQAADLNKTPVYVSHLATDDANFGKSNTDTTAFGSIAKVALFGDGPSYRIYFPSSSLYRTDTILSINQYVAQWEDALANNEKEKLESKLIQNYSFHAGSPISYTRQFDTSYTQTNAFTIVLSGSVMNSTDFKVQGAGFEFKLNESVGTSQGGSFDYTNDNSSTMGFNLAADGVGEYLSVDVNDANDGSGFVFRTKGGETECPYEGGSVTQYYQPGTPLDQPTAQMDKPQITVEKPVVNDIPSTQQASYTIHLQNASEAQWSTDFVLGYGNTDSIKGATIDVDGVSIAGGRTFPVNYGQTVTKVLTIAKGPDAMDYNNIPIILHSACQYDPTGYQDLIADTVLVSAHFVPSCSNINVKSPSDQWVLNIASPTNTEGKRYLPIVLDQFDITNSLFDHIELQYKPSSSSQWVTAMSFYADSTKYNDAQGEKQFITNAQEIQYNLVMDDASFNDQGYDVRAVSVCHLGPGNDITTPSNVVSGIKDTYAPRLFGSPEPANGVLGVGDDIRLNFNEPIAAGLITPADFQVTGIRNGAQGDHSVSAQLDGKSNYIETEFGKNMSGRDITAEMWVLPDDIENGTVFSQGNLNESMELAFTSDNHLQVIVGTKKITSDKTLNYQKGNWAHVALVYNAEDSTVSAFYNFEAVIQNVSVPAYHGNGVFDFGRSISQQGNFFAGKMHEARVWTHDLTGTTLQVNSLTRFSGAEDGLLAYYPMTEGKGSTIFDQAHGNNATLNGLWSTPPGKAIQLDGNGYVKISTGTAPITSGMDYTIGLWFKGAPGQSDATLASNGKGDGTDPGSAASANLFSLGFENGLLTFKNNGFKVQADGNYLDNHWHHVAVAVNRTAATARLFVDGDLQKFFNTQNLGGIAGAYTYLGARAYYTDTDAVSPVIDRNFKGEIDEFRVWNTYLSQSLITGNSNVRLNGDELGLMAYYPFEKYYEFQGQKELDTTLADQKIQDDPKVKVPDAIAVHAELTDDMAPIKDRGPVNNLNFDFVVNNDALIINLLEPKQAIDKTIVTLQAKDIRDVQGNPLLSPITWTAFIDQNPLKWSDDELNLSKDLYQPLQFESYVVNSGGSNENFTLDNLPGWLTADVTSGTVPPEGKQKITFTVDAGLNVGTYNEIVYMSNDNGESEALPVNVKVNGQTPDWKVNPADFKYNMTIYGKIRIDNIFSDDPGDILAAFVDGKCVGVTNNTFFSGQDLWYAFLTVYSDSIHANNLEFRIWDASTGKIYEGLPSEPIVFDNNSVVGNPDAPVIFDGKEMLFENIGLAKGWNWISFNLVSNSLKTPNAALANGTWQSGDIIKHDERGFDQYSFTNGWIGTLPALDITSLFKLSTNNAQTLSISGTLPDMKNIPIQVNGGRWNYIGYLPQVNMTLKEALADYTASSGDEIKSQTGFSMYSDTKGWIGNLSYLEPGKGYMLYRKASTSTQFVYPDISGSLTIHRIAGIAGNFERLNADQSPVPGNYTFSDNMTVLAEAGKEFTLMPGDKVIAYAGAEVRGEALPISNPVTGASNFFFNISGKDNQLIHFEIDRNGKSVAQTDQVMSYMANSMIGTLQNPFMLHFGKPSVETGIFPNPFRDEVTVHVTLSPGAHEIQMMVYDVNGRLVRQYGKETTDGQYYEATWNGRNSNGSICSAGAYFIHLLVDGKSHVYKVVKY